jgi:hypothetical protein
VQREPGDGASFQSQRGPDGCDAWVCGEVQAIWLLAIRCALKSRHEPHFINGLFSLEDHCQIRPAASQRVVAEAAVRLSGALYAAGLLEQAEHWVARLLGCLLTNAFGVRGGAALGSSRLDVRAPTLAVSLSASLFNHDCDPNVHTDHLLVNGRLSFRALRPIAVGEECFISCTYCADAYPIDAYPTSAPWRTLSAAAGAAAAAAAAGAAAAAAAAAGAAAAAAAAVAAAAGSRCVPLTHLWHVISRPLVALPHAPPQIRPRKSPRMYAGGSSSGPSSFFAAAVSARTLWSRVAVVASCAACIASVAGSGRRRTTTTPSRCRRPQPLLRPLRGGAARARR